MKEPSKKITRERENKGIIIGIGGKRRYICIIFLFLLFLHLYNLYKKNIPSLTTIKKHNPGLKKNILKMNKQKISISMIMKEYSKI